MFLLVNIVWRPKLPYENCSKPSQRRKSNDLSKRVSNEECVDVLKKPLLTALAECFLKVN